MKKPHVLNRPMFNKGGTSAYGRGIASNLVTDEQRQRFNSGGRVRLQEGSGYNWWDTPLGREIKDVGTTFKTIGAAGYDLAGVPLNALSRFTTGYNPGFSGANFFGIEPDKPDTSYWMGIPTSTKKGWAHKQKAEEAKKGTEKNKLDAILAAADAENKAAAAEAGAKAKAAAAEGAQKDPNVIDLTDSERAGLKATLYAGAGAGALDPSNKTVADVLRNTLLGASKAGEKIYDPTTERKYRKYAEARKDIGEADFKRKTEWETSDKKLMSEMATKIGKQGAEEMMAFNTQVPKTGSGAEYNTIKKSITKSKKKGAPLAGLLVFDTDIQKYMVWDAQLKEYRHVPGNIDQVKKVLTELRE